jgi:hypothetical protein
VKGNWAIAMASFSLILIRQFLQHLAGQSRQANLWDSEKTNGADIAGWYGFWGISTLLKRIFKKRRATRWSPFVFGRRNGRLFGLFSERGSDLTKDRSELVAQEGQDGNNDDGHQGEDQAVFHKGLTFAGLEGIETIRQGNIEFS